MTTSPWAKYVTYGMRYQEYSGHFNERNWPKGVVLVPSSTPHLSQYLAYAVMRYEVSMLK